MIWRPDRRRPRPYDLSFATVQDVHTVPLNRVIEALGRAHAFVQAEESEQLFTYTPPSGNVRRARLPWGHTIDARLDPRLVGYIARGDDFTLTLAHMETAVALNLTNPRTEDIYCTVDGVDLRRATIIAGVARTLYVGGVR